jgi:hypothetical protein
MMSFNLYISMITKLKYLVNACDRIESSTFFAELELPVMNSMFLISLQKRKLIAT